MGRQRLHPATWEGRSRRALQAARSPIRIKRDSESTSLEGTLSAAEPDVPVAPEQTHRPCIRNGVSHGARSGAGGDHGDGAVGGPNRVLEPRPLLRPPNAPPHRPFGSERGRRPALVPGEGLQRAGTQSGEMPLWVFSTERKAMRMDWLGMFQGWRGLGCEDGVHDRPVGKALRGRGKRDLHRACHLQGGPLRASPNSRCS